MDAEILTDYQRLALDLLRRELTPHITGVSVKEGEDFAQEQALFFEAHLDEDAPADIGGENFLNAHVRLFDELEKLGERRFPYLSTSRPDGDKRPRDLILNTRLDPRRKRRGATR